MWISAVVIRRFLSSAASLRVILPRTFVKALFLGTSWASSKSLLILLLKYLSLLK